MISHQKNVSCIKCAQYSSIKLDIIKFPNLYFVQQSYLKQGWSETKSLVLAHYSVFFNYNLL